jgi:chaperonin cofactor prefoldin
MVTVETLQTEVRDLKRRLDLTETRVGQMEGRFEFVTGQLKDIQLYMHAKFSDMDTRFDRMDARFDRMDARFDRVETRQDRLEQKIDALPRVLAEMLAKR